MAVVQTARVAQRDRLPEAVTLSGGCEDVSNMSAVITATSGLVPTLLVSIDARRHVLDILLRDGPRP